MTIPVMTIAEGFQNKGAPFMFTGCTRFDFPEFLAGIGLKVGVEIGVSRGEMTEEFCKAGLKLFGIDPWVPFPGQGRCNLYQSTADIHLGITLDRMAPYIENGLCTFIKKTSMDALDDFQRGSLDFVYMDGRHEFPFIAEDVYYWSDKVRTGGIVAGHDYRNSGWRTKNTVYHVKAIIDAYTVLYEIENWWVFGKGQDWSWAWIKP